MRYDVYQVNLLLLHWLSWGLRYHLDLSRTEQGKKWIVKMRYKLTFDMRSCCMRSNNPWPRRTLRIICLDAGGRTSLSICISTEFWIHYTSHQVTASCYDYSFTLLCVCCFFFVGVALCVCVVLRHCTCICDLELQKITLLQMCFLW